MVKVSGYVLSLAGMVHHWTGGVSLLDPPPNYLPPDCPLPPPRMRGIPPPRPIPPPDMRNTPPLPFDRRPLPPHIRSPPPASFSDRDLRFTSIWSHG